MTKEYNYVTFLELLVDPYVSVTLEENHYKIYSNHLNTGLVWFSNDRFVSGCQMMRYLNGGLKTILKNACLWSKMSSIQLVSRVT